MPALWRLWKGKIAKEGDFRQHLPRRAIAADPGTTGIRLAAVGRELCGLQGGWVWAEHSLYTTQ